MIAVYWDFDGTLVKHAHALWSTCALRALREADPSTTVTLEQIRSLMQCFPWNEWQQDHTAHVGAAWWAYMETRFAGVYRQLGISAAVAGQAARNVRAWVLRRENYPLYEDALGTLAALKVAGCKQFLLSNNYPELPEIAHALGLGTWLDGVIVSALAGYDKPRPELFAMAKSRCPEADAYVMIGDNPIADVQGGRDAGMRTVLVHRGFYPSADVCFDNLRDIVPWILQNQRKIT